MGRSSASRVTSRTPSAIPLSRLGRSLRDGSGSGRRIRATHSADHTYPNAVATIASGRGHQLDEQAAGAGTDHARHLLHSGQPGVGGDEAVATDHVRQVALLGDVEEDGEDAGDEGDRAQVEHVEGAEAPRHRNAAQGDGAAEVAATITVRLRIRSTHTPAGSPTTRNAAVWQAATALTSKAEACRVVVARRGIAKPEQAETELAQRLGGQQQAQGAHFARAGGGTG